MTRPYVHPSDTWRDHNAREGGTPQLSAETLRLTAAWRAWREREARHG